MNKEQVYKQAIISFDSFKWIITTINCFNVEGLERCVDWVRHKEMKQCENYIDWKGQNYLHKVASEIRRVESDRFDETGIMHKAWEAEKVYKVLA